ncbi:hypothetical protein B0H15DRAFT_948672 [Mycena belliarum]|uniref:Uncharacterized protein n=1 Tax=Mycena belliarum TaxID=1033014 RepID=A0AAD6U6S3_9AGAR|nr:hypothetical protein B0H15DRAFT_948672 [Mycena belliae]
MQQFWFKLAASNGLWLEAVSIVKYLRFLSPAQVQSDCARYSHKHNASYGAQLHRTHTKSLPPRTKFRLAWARPGALEYRVCPPAALRRSQRRAPPPIPTWARTGAFGHRPSPRPSTQSANPASPRNRAKLDSAGASAALRRAGQAGSGLLVAGFWSARETGVFRSSPRNRAKPDSTAQARSRRCTRRASVDTGGPPESVRT